jgi:hypothetical protein
MRKIPRPDKSVPVLEADGRTMSQAWFDFFGYLEMRGVLDAPDVDNSTAITNNQVLIFNSTAGKLKPGAN